MRYPPLALAEDLETRMGPARDPAFPLSHAAACGNDDRAAYPWEASAVLDEWGLADYAVPTAHGGRLTSIDQAVHLMRAVARRDLTLAIGHGRTFLGAVSVWLEGSPEQAQSLARRLTSGERICWALTERAHGSDLLSGELSAVGDGSGYTLHGEKWLINGATDSGLVCVLARTAAEAGPRGFGVFLVDKADLAPGTFRCLPKVRTYGIRGADISGIAFDGAHLGAAAAIGSPDRGAETVLKGLQLTRTLCTALSLGAGDGALRSAAHAVHESARAQGPPDAPGPRRALARSYADHLLGEAVSIAAARAVTVLPGESSITSAVAKFAVPHTTEAAVAALEPVVDLCAPSEPTARAFAKARRDNRIVGLFDGNSVINRHALINQFPTLSRAESKGRVSPDAEAVFDLGTEAPSISWERISLAALHGSSVVQALPTLVERAAGGGGAAAALAPAARRLGRVHERVRAELAAYRPVALHAPPEAFDLARRYALCFAGAACLWLWLDNASGAAAGAGGRVDLAEPLWADALWVRAALARVLERIGAPAPADTGADDALLGAMWDQFAGGRLFSLLDCRVEDE
ncbi:acyl-CoA dehydrogenase family protein [Streptomonospora salina]|uniref:Alkylation response protein AidB-like acyl-CoA dehydrogenase n=1 Tax=Streptomonospora salina TaxID=104205 RepID=A0A841EFB8_9ACTN|nr:acyl-CoA dehydrogenase family protein [Streptomonospora salina]MBB6001014.1 alkylation response protein AidB-like acyl-CoA dehydrogenase [Streptomonospora salina]